MNSFTRTSFLSAKLQIHLYEFVRVFSMLCCDWPVLYLPVSGQLPPGQLPPGQLPPDKYPPDNYPPRTNTPGTFTPPEKFFKHLPWYSLYLYSSYSFQRRRYQDSNQRIKNIVQDYPNRKIMQYLRGLAHNISM